MTKVSVLDLKESNESKVSGLKLIEFCLFIDTKKGDVRKPVGSPDDYKNTNLISKEVNDCNYDVIIAWNAIERVYTYLGHWNDGVVE